MKVVGQPVVYQINTAAFLSRVGCKLDEVPGEEWDKLASLGVDAVWLMGIWERSPAGNDVSKSHPDFELYMRKVLPDLSDEDIIGSAYSIRGYEVNQAFGGPEALAKARHFLAERGIGLILDFIPNHVGLDHEWISQPERFITGSAEDLVDLPDNFYEVNGTIFARGRDPQWPAWSDVLQLNAFSQAYREVAVETLVSISKLCDGVRCDMAMLMLNEVFKQTWGDHAGEVPETDFWPSVIPAVREQTDDFLLLGEAYWSTGEILLEQGFDYCYDKELYDFLLKDSGTVVGTHLEATKDYRQGLCVFIENHDEPRSAAAFNPGRLRAAATVIATLPGMLLLHDGQLQGYKIRIPAQLVRGPEESTDEELQRFYDRLLPAVKPWRVGDWRQIESNNGGVLIWERLLDGKKLLIITNYSSRPGKVITVIGDDSLLQAQSLFDVISQEDVQLKLPLHLEPWETLVLTQP